MTGINPLLQRHVLPPFNAIEPEHIASAFSALFAANRQEIADIVENNAQNWEELVVALDELQDKLDQAWSPVGHLNAVKNNEALRDAYNAVLPQLSEYYSELGQSEALYSLFQGFDNHRDQHGLDTAQQRVISNTLRDFRLSGVALDQAAKDQYRIIRKSLSELTSKFSENVLDATQGWTRLITEPSELAGVPESSLAAMAEAASAKGKTGYLLTLEFPSYMPIMTYCDNRALREEVYQAFVTRASDQGPNAGKWDNSEIIEQVLEQRLKLAKLLGFANYAEYSLETKMAESPQQVIDFLQGLGEKALPQARTEYAEVLAFAQAKGDIEALQPWDVGYFSELLRQEKYAISQEALRPYFPAEKVIQGMFEVVQRLYQINIRQRENIETWHPDVTFYDVLENGNVIGSFYLDLYARENKRGGAWMDECRVRRKTRTGDLQLPVAYLTCNFNGPVGDKPALLTHNEVITLFHEFGHGLHHLLTKIEASGVSGIRGVAWDAVELPSQFMENWCWEEEGLNLISEHFETGETLPSEMLEKMLAAKNFQAAMQLMRQLEFSLFDMRIHMATTEQSIAQVQQVLQSVREQVSVVPVAAYNRFQHSFSHIFAGGYAAGYYSYKWAEVLSADAFARFEEEGVFNGATGQSFRQNILEKGGSEEPLALFTRFRGREPSVDSLLRHSGLLQN